MNAEALLVPPLPAARRFRASLLPAALFGIAAVTFSAAGHAQTKPITTCDASAW